jgi:hypothetical protein
MAANLDNTYGVTFTDFFRPRTLDFGDDLWAFFIGFRAYWRSCNEPGSCPLNEQVRRREMSVDRSEMAIGPTYSWIACMEST